MAPDARIASRRAAIIAAAYTALMGLFPTQKTALDASYAASLAALSDDDEDDDGGGQSRKRGIAWGTDVGMKVLGWRATDGFSASYPPFTGGPAVGQWRPTPPAFGPMSAQGLAFTNMFVLISNAQFRPAPPRGLTGPTYTSDFNAVKALGRKTGSTRTDDQSALAVFWEGNASVHWNQAANQIARANRLSISETNRLLAVLIQEGPPPGQKKTVRSAARPNGDVATGRHSMPVGSCHLWWHVLPLSVARIVNYSVNLHY